MATSTTVEHDLTQWSTVELQMRFDLLETFSSPASIVELDEWDRRNERILCGCGDMDPCSVDDRNAIDRELGTRAY